MNRQLKIEQHEPHQLPGLNSVTVVNPCSTGGTPRVTHNIFFCEFDFAHFVCVLQIIVCLLYLIFGYCTI